MKKHLLIGFVFFSFIAQAQMPGDSLASFLDLEVPRATIQKHRIKKVTYTKLPMPFRGLTQLYDTLAMEFDRYGYPTKRVGEEYGDVVYENKYSKDGRLLSKKTTTAGNLYYEVFVYDSQSVLKTYKRGYAYTDSIAIEKFLKGWRAYDTLMYDSTAILVTYDDAFVTYDSMGKVDTVEGGNWRNYCRYNRDGKIDAMSRESMIHDWCGAVGSRLHTEFDEKGRMVEIENNGFGPFDRSHYTLEYDKKGILTTINIITWEVRTSKRINYTFTYTYNQKNLPSQVKISNDKTDEVLVVGYAYEYY